MAKALESAKEISKKKTASLELVLEYYDGPQAVLLQKSDNSRIVGVAVDVEGYSMPFFGAEISLQQWEKYRRGFVDFRYLFMFPFWKSWYYFDLMDEPDSIKLVKTDKDAAAETDFVPEHGFFSHHHSEPINIDIKKGRAVQKYKTDGNWDLPDFTTFYHKVSDLYVFFLALKLFRDETTTPDKKRMIREAFMEQPLRGGSSYLHLYKLLFSSQDFDDRLIVGKLQYASPGQIEVRGRFDIFSDISTSYERINSAYDDVKTAYNQLYKHLHELGLLRSATDRFDPKSAMASDVKKRADDFAKALEIGETKTIYALTGENSLTYAKILLAHFRRVERYFLFFAEGRVKDPEAHA